MRGRRQPVLHKDYDSESGSTSSEDCVVDQSRPEDITVEINSDTDQEPQAENAPETLFSPRSYQLEMFYESLRQNIIVAMDTGSGKTHIAVLRIIEELKNSPADKLVWFLAPTVDLCIQQHALLEMEIPAVQTRLLQGNDGVEKWKDQKLWDAILRNVRIVVSTHQILLDALDNAFVQLEKLSLLIFDEAHNCVGNHAGVRIMRDFYQHNKVRGLFVPHILGLSASPIMRSKDQSPEKIEETLNAICRTPKLHRIDLLKHVNLPEFHQILYNETASNGIPQALYILQKIYTEYDISRDPFILSLQEEDTPRNQRILHGCLMSNKTWCYKQIKTLYNTSKVILEELGPWAANYYITEVIKRLQNLVNLGDFYIEDRHSYKEKRHLCNLFAPIDPIQASHEMADGTPIVSDKVAQLLSTLPRDGALCGIIFAKQRATVAVLGHLLAVHPATRSSLRIGTVVGSSQHSQHAANIGDLFASKSPASPLDPDSPQLSALEKFRSGELDLVIATTVLEEGIDVPACNLVLCFDEPSNLKSFVQRRGRARMKESRLILMQKAGSTTRLRQWQELELVMKRMYADHMRQLREEAQIEDLEQHDGREYRVESTGALLNLDNAVSHLFHFCSLLPPTQHVDLHPEFIYSKNAPTKVILPLCCDEVVRIAWSKKVWLSERNAKKDASFEAYLALYRAGLVNDNLMPLMKTDPFDGNLNGIVEKRPSVVKANHLINPWVDVARAWLRMPGVDSLRKIQCTVYNCGEILSAIEMILPFDIPLVPRFRLYWDATTQLWIEIRPANPNTPVKEGELEQAQNATRAIFSTAFGWRFPIEESSFCAPFMPTLETREMASNSSICESQTWKQGPWLGLIRDKKENGQPYMFEEYLDYKPCDTMVKDVYKEYHEVEGNVAHLTMMRVTRRTDFLHKVVGASQRSSKRPDYILPVARCAVDEIPFRVTQLALLMPSILHRLEVFMIGHRLSRTILADVKFNDLSLVVTALSASSAVEETNYQRLEFLGDSLLKMCTSMQLLAEYPLWHEGYLTAKRGQVISNSRLSQAALQTGLDKFIITKSFTGRRWRPHYVQGLAEVDLGDAKRDISTKVLADVVEALFGSAKVDGGVSRALACMRVFLPEINWQPLEDRRAALFSRALTDKTLPPPLEPLENLIGYVFNKKVLLIEAMTHASCNTGIASLERLEFLGDSVLDSIIVNTISEQEVELSHVEMHHLRTAFVNADYLAFMCMEWAIDQEVGGVIEDERTHSFHPTTSIVSVPLWKFMLHSSHELSRMQLKTSKRHQALRDDIKLQLASGSQYPWALLSRLSAPKFYSDIVESLLGSVYIDSGSLDACEGIIEKMGILPYLRRVIQDRVHILHPKEELGILADVEKVKYVVEGEKKIIESVECRLYTCAVIVGDVHVALVSDGVSIEEAKTKAAEAAVRVLKQRRAAGGNNFTLDDDIDRT